MPGAIFCQPLTQGVEGWHSGVRTQVEHGCSCVFPRV